MDKKISVLITTYNGEKYIKRILDSIKKQTLNADEVLIKDDKSTDCTVELVNKYINDNELINWKVTVNPQNKGWRVNFMEGFSQVSGDYIFPCDQDDIWHLDKIEKMIDIMESHPQIELLASDYSVKYEKRGVKISRRLLKNLKNDGTIEKVLFDEKFMNTNRPGCCYCVTRNLIDKAQNAWNPSMAHDAALWRTANLEGTLYLYHEKLIDFIRHGDNSSDLKEKNKNIVISYLESIHSPFIFWANNYIISTNVEDTENKLVILNRAKVWNSLRMEWLKNKRIGAYLKLLLYVKFYSSFKQYVGDLYLCLK